MEPTKTSPSSPENYEIIPDNSSYTFPPQPPDNAVGIMNIVGFMDLKLSDLNTTQKAQFLVDVLDAFQNDKLLLYSEELLRKWGIEKKPKI